MKTLLREPLLYFLLLGGVFFLVYQQFSNDYSRDPDQKEEILVSQALIEAMQQRFKKTWQRFPSDSERESLIDGFVREEIYYREALALGLDRDDAVVRRRLRQKLEFISEDLIALAEPDDRELQAYLDTNADTYRQSTVYRFQQVYLNPNKRGEQVEIDAMALLARLRDGSADAASAGDSIMLQYQFENASDRIIEREFGQPFLQQLAQLPAGSWQGPIVSGFGLHLVYVDERVDGEVPQLDEVRGQVLRDWTSVERKEANKAIYEGLRKRYKVITESPPGVNEGKAALDRGAG
jgi:hypothetical protein